MGSNPLFAIKTEKLNKTEGLRLKFRVEALFFYAMKLKYVIIMGMVKK